MSTVKVKVKVSTLISHLEKALAERVARHKNQPKEHEKYEKALEDYKSSVLKLIKSGKGVVTDISQDTYFRQKGKSSFEVTFVLPTSLLPTEPEQPDETPEYRHKEECDEIRQAIRVLKLTDEQYVSASTYASVAKYL